MIKEKSKPHNIHAPNIVCFHLHQFFKVIINCLGRLVHYRVRNHLTRFLITNVTIWNNSLMNLTLTVMQNCEKKTTKFRNTTMLGGNRNVLTKWIIPNYSRCLLTWKILLLDGYYSLSVQCNLPKQQWKQNLNVSNCNKKTVN